MSVCQDTHIYTQKWKSIQLKVKRQGPLTGEGRWQVRILQDQHCGSLKIKGAPLFSCVCWHKSTSVLAEVIGQLYVLFLVNTIHHFSVDMLLGALFTHVMADSSVFCQTMMLPRYLLSPLFEEGMNHLEKCVWHGSSFLFLENVSQHTLLHMSESYVSMEGLPGYNQQSWKHEEGTI